MSSSMWRLTRRGVCTSSRLAVMRRRSEQQELMFLDKAITEPQLHVKDGYYDRACDELDIDDAKYIDKLCAVWTGMMKERREFVRRRDDEVLIETNRHKWLPTIDELQPRIAYTDIEALKTAPESVRRVLSIDYGRRGDKTDSWRKTLMDSVRNHPLDDNDSLESKIGHHTARIRQTMSLIDEMKQFSPLRPTTLLNMVNTSLELRRELMGELRETDVESFDRVLSTLGIAYHTPVLNEDEPDWRRKEWVKRAILRRAQLEKERKVDMLRVALDKQRALVGDKYAARLLEIDEQLATANEEISSSTERLHGAPLPSVPPIEASSIDSVTEKFQTRHFYMNVGRANKKKRST